MIHGVGIDVLATEHLRHLDGRWDDAFFLRTFAPIEREQALASRDPLGFFAGRFAAKEACFKALRVNSNDIRLSQIAIIDDRSGEPQVDLRSPGPSPLQPGTHLHVQIASDRAFTLALAVLEDEKAAGSAGRHDGEPTAGEPSKQPKGSFRDKDLRHEVEGRPAVQTDIDSTPPTASSPSTRRTREAAMVATVHPQAACCPDDPARRDPR